MITLKDFPAIVALILLVRFAVSLKQGNFDKAVIRNCIMLEIQEQNREDQSVV